MDRKVRNGGGETRALMIKQTSKPIKEINAYERALVADERSSV